MKKALKEYGKTLALASVIYAITFALCKVVDKVLETFVYPRIDDAKSKKVIDEEDEEVETIDSLLSEAAYIQKSLSMDMEDSKAKALRERLHQVKDLLAEKNIFINIDTPTDVENDFIKRFNKYAKSFINKQYGKYVDTDETDGTTYPNSENETESENVSSSDEAADLKSNEYEKRETEMERAEEAREKELR